MSKEHGGIEYFGIYPDPDPYRSTFGSRKIDTGVKKSGRNQKIADQRRVERKLGLPHKQHTIEEIAFLRAKRMERLSGVTLYVRDAVAGHTKDLIPEIIDCA